MMLRAWHVLAVSQLLYKPYCKPHYLPCKLQLHSDDGTQTLDLKQSLLQPSLAKLKALLENGNIVKVFHGCQQDAERLYMHHAIKVQNVFDTQVGVHLAKCALLHCQTAFLSAMLPTSLVHRCQCRNEVYLIVCLLYGVLECTGSPQLLLAWALAGHSWPQLATADNCSGF